MKAALYNRYGPPEVVFLGEVAKPEPKGTEVLVRVLATTVTTGDWRARSLELPTGFGLLGRLIFGFSGPRQPILGMEFAGDVEAVGDRVTRFSPGDKVFGFTGVRMGCHAEYLCLPEDAAVVHKPANLSYDEAAALSFGGTTALDFFRRAGLSSGERVLVNGASGGVGSAAVQLAKQIGAEVTGVCSTANIELVRSLGADHVIDYTRQDFAAAGKRYEVIIDTAGTAPFARSKAALAERGRLLVVISGLAELLKAPIVSALGNRKIVVGPASERPEDVRRLAELAAAGQFRPLIDSRYPFDQVVEAHRHVDGGHKRGNVVITLDESSSSA